MKELNLIEVEQVSGAGAIIDAAGALGAGIGSVIDAINHDSTQSSQNAGHILGSNIGKIIEDHLRTHHFPVSVRPLN
ncbi:hypothetical protein B6D12_04500 [Gilliamella apicola]|uniref:hypothetical protein n=1 Tax=Gilliamella TaxID=1193503 RepID=UPI000810A9DE|nr:hypothetical protein [Gilliamella apicola]OCF92495.1 hypothetical protein A9G17_04865 [Gilliamella apicola]OTP87330.1 hypothetical protein B5S41_12395 [Gilliamella apicola]OTP92008.1 hypothetical protein B6D05_13140 [Gilliamella apicola]OTP94768.1 hypothetical protein B6D13_05945 [Gilliamella apicola]OTP98013.1 hypothetical protein B6D07_13325 [Gilliamella apicola]